MSNPLAGDLDQILERTTSLWEPLRGERIFITGGTGFFGCWLLESFLWANDRLRLDASALVLTRRPDAFRRDAPHLANHPAVRLHEGDVRTFAFPEGTFSSIIHAATDAVSPSGPDASLLLFDTIVGGTRRTLEFARLCGARRFLLTSSGAVYGRQPGNLPNIPEEYCGGSESTNPGLSYVEGKRAAEMLCVLFGNQRGLEVTIARCFAFVGPYLPLDEHFAVGNFIRDGLGGGPIRIKGDGTPHRSYLYAADLAVWLWTILLRGGAMRPYNVGSSEDVTIADVARLVAQAFRPAVSVQAAQRPVPGAQPERYVPDVTRADVELGLRPTTSLEDAIQKTIAWHARANAPLQIARG